MELTVPILQFVMQNPSLVGMILFVPLFLYFLKFYSDDKQRNQQFTDSVLKQAGDREDKLHNTITSTLTEQTKVLNSMNTNLTMIHQTMNSLSERVEDVEDIVEKLKQN